MGVVQLTANIHTQLVFGVQAPARAVIDALCADLYLLSGNTTVERVVQVSDVHLQVSAGAHQPRLIEHIRGYTRRQRRVAGQLALTVVQAGAVDGHALPSGQCAGLVTDRATRLEPQRPITLHQALIVIERPNPKHQVLA